MARFLLRRLGLVLPALWLVSVLIFALAEIVPGDVARTILGPYATPDQAAALRHQLGADRGSCAPHRSEEHTSELQSRGHLVCRLLLEKKKRIHDDNERSVTRATI